MAHLLGAEALHLEFPTKVVFDRVSLGIDEGDRIADFNASDDEIALENAFFTELLAGALPGSAFVAGPKAVTADQHIIYQADKGILLYDSDGSGAGAAVRFAVLTGAPVLIAADFVVV